MSFLLQLFQQISFLCTASFGGSETLWWWENTETPHTEPSDAEVAAAVDTQLLSKVHQEEAANSDSELPDTDSAYEGSEGEDKENHKGEGVDFIEKNLANIQIQIDELKQKGLSDLSENDLDKYIALQQQQKELENQKQKLLQQNIAVHNEAQAEQEAVIGNQNEIKAEGNAAIEDLDNQARSGIEEIKSFLAPDIRKKFPNLEKFLAPTDAILSKSKLTEDDDNALKEALTNTLDYLKQAQNEDELLSIYRGMQDKTPNDAIKFRAFLVEQDPDFIPIFERFDTSPQTEEEATLAAALQTQPTSGNPHDGFTAEMEDGTSVHVETWDDGMVRSIDLDGANYPIETEVQDVSLTKAESERETVLNEFWPKKQVAQQTLKMLEENPNADFSKIKDSLKNSLSSEEYSELGIDALADIESAKLALQRKIDTYTKKIDEAQNKFRKITQEAVRKTRESYERKDEKIKLTLKTIKYSGLGKLGMDWLARDLASSTVLPNIGVSFHPENVDPEDGNFWEPATMEDNPTVHLEYIYRLANKAISGDPTEPFSLDPTLLAAWNPQPIANSDAALNGLLEEHDVWNSTTGVNREDDQPRLIGPVSMLVDDRPHV